MKTLLITCLFLGTASTSSSGPPLAPMDAPTFAEKATELMIVKCLNRDTTNGAHKTRAFHVEVDILSVIKGDQKTGKQELMTISNPMETGKVYLMAVFRTNPHQPVFEERSEQGYTEISPSFDLKTLKDKTPAQQALMIFVARRNDLDAQILKLQKELKVLEVTHPKPEK